MTTERELGWFIANNKRICQALGVDKLSVVVDDDNVYFETWTNGQVERFDDAKHLINLCREATFPVLTIASGIKIQPNNPCPCGSGKKYKKCCLHKEN